MTVWEQIAHSTSDGCQTSALLLVWQVKEVFRSCLIRWMKDGWSDSVVFPVYVDLILKVVHPKMIVRLSSMKPMTFFFLHERQNMIFLSISGPYFSWYVLPVKKFWTRFTLIFFIMWKHQWLSSCKKDFKSQSQVFKTTFVLFCFLL